MKRTISFLTAFIAVVFATTTMGQSLLPRQHRGAHLGKSGQAWSNVVCAAIYLDTGTGTNKVTTDDGKLDASQISGTGTDQTFVNPTITNATFLGNHNGAGFTNLNATQLLSGTVPTARLDADLQPLESRNAGALTNLNGNAITGGVFDSVSVTTSTGATCVANITATALDPQANSIGAARTFQFWFTTAAVQTVPSTNEMDSWSFVAHGSVDAYLNNTTEPVYIGTTHTDGTMDIEVTVTGAAVKTNYFFALSPNGKITKTMIVYP